MFNAKIYRCTTSKYLCQYPVSQNLTRCIVITFLLDVHACVHFSIWTAVKESFYLVCLQLATLFGGTPNSDTFKYLRDCLSSNLEIWYAHTCLTSPSAANTYLCEWPIFFVGLLIMAYPISNKSAIRCCCCYTMFSSFPLTWFGLASKLFFI